MDWYNNLDEDRQSAILVQVEDNALNESIVGGFTDSVQKRCRAGEGVVGGQKMAEVKKEAFSFGVRNGGQLNPFTDELMVRSVYPMIGMKKLTNGMALNISRLNHEISHYMVDQANPDEGFTDTLTDSGITIDLERPMKQIKDSIEFNNVGEPKNDYTRFLQNYRNKYHPESDKNERYWEDEALKRLDKFRRDMHNGGLVLT